MNPKRGSTRRRFLKNATALGVAASAAASSHAIAGVGFGKPKAEKIKLGVRPETVTPGPAVLESGSNIHLVFYGCQEDKRGNDLGDGTVLITLKECKKWRLRLPGDEEVASHSIDLNELDFCEVYEVKNSDWRPDLKASEKTSALESRKNRSRKTKTSDLKHYICTFFGFDPGLSNGGTHFECLATGIEAILFKNADFDALKSLVASSDSEPKRNGSRVREATKTKKAPSKYRRRRIRSRFF